MARKFSPQSKSSPKRVTALLKASKAVRLRAIGFTFDHIASEVGFAHRTNAKRAVESYLAAERGELSEAIEQQRQMVDKSIDVLMTKAFGIVLDECEKTENRLRAIDTANKLLARRCALFGLDMPVKIHHQGDPLVNVNIAELSDEQLERLAAGDFTALPAGTGAARASTSGEKPS